MGQWLPFSKAPTKCSSQHPRYGKQEVESVCRRGLLHVPHLGGTDENLAESQRLHACAHHGFLS